MPEQANSTRTLFKVTPNRVLISRQANRNRFSFRSSFMTGPMFFSTARSVWLEKRAMERRGFFRSFRAGCWYRKISSFFFAGKEIKVLNFPIFWRAPKSLQSGRNRSPSRSHRIQHGTRCWQCHRSWKLTTRVPRLHFHDSTQTVWRDIS